MRTIDRVLKASTEQGQSILARVHSNEGKTLGSIYGSWSAEKQNGYNACMELFQSMNDHEDFHICSHNGWSFTVAWSATIDGEDVEIYCTSNHTYCVYLDR